MPGKRADPKKATHKEKLQVKDLDSSQDPKGGAWSWGMTLGNTMNKSQEGELGTANRLNTIDPHRE
jgi:hypothetical protein